MHILSGLAGFIEGGTRQNTGQRRCGVVAGVI